MNNSRLRMIDRKRAWKKRTYSTWTQHSL